MLKKVFYVLCGLGLGIGVGYGMACHSKEAYNYRRDHKQESDRIRRDIERDFNALDKLLGVNSEPDSSGSKG